MDERERRLRRQANIRIALCVAMIVLLILRWNTHGMTLAVLTLISFAIVVYLFASFIYEVVVTLRNRRIHKQWIERQNWRA